MQSQAITIRTGTESQDRVITAEEINRLALELGELGNQLVETGVAMVTKGIQLGEALTIKKAEIDRLQPGTWVMWCAENLEFSERSIRNYRNLYADRQRVADGIESGQVTSLRTAIALLSSDEGGKWETKHFGAIPEKEQTTKLGRVMAKFWSVFHRTPLTKWGDRERDEFLVDLAERERIRKQQGWNLPTIDVEEVKP